MALAALDLSGIPSSARIQGRDSWDAPLLGFDPPPRYVPKSLFPTSRCENHSPEVYAPSVHAAWKSTALASYPARAPHDLHRENLLTVPPVSYGVAHRLSQPFSDFFLPKPSHHFQMGNALGVSPFRGFPFRAAPYGSSPPACPLDVAPSVNCFRPKRKLPWARAVP